MTTHLAEEGNDTLYSSVIINILIKMHQLSWSDSAWNRKVNMVPEANLTVLEADASETVKRGAES